MAEKVFKSPLAQSQAMTKAPRVRTIDDAKRDIKHILANDMNNSVFEAYDDYLESQGKPRQIKTLANGEPLYPKGSWKNIINDEEYLKKNVLPYLTEEYGYSDDYDIPDLTDEQVDSGIAFYLKNYR